MNIASLHQLFLESSIVCTDTRNITPDCLFFALKGDNFNGNSFAQDALDKGAKYAVIDESAFYIENKNTLLFDDVLSTLQMLATYHRKYLKLQILAITGSNGKTTSKELINAVLGKKFRTVATKGNLNNHIGVPLTLLSMDKNTEMGIVEMGANHLGEIESLSNIAQPDYGYITNFGKAHLEGFGSLEGVVQGKSELYTFLNKKGATVFVNGWDKKQVEITKEMSRFIFGDAQQHCTVQLIESKNKLKITYKEVEILSNLVGVYNFYNIAAAIAIGDYFKIPVQDIKAAIESYIPKNNRSQLLEKNGHHILLDAYNANPTSMLAALHNFQQAEGTSKLMILGDMFELGETAAEEHQAIVDFLEKNAFGKAFLVGEHFYNTKFTSSKISSFQTFQALEEHLENYSLPIHSNILIKGSRGMALERVLDIL